jgi:hypothetical protein
MAKRPSVSVIKYWDNMYESDLVKVEMGTTPFDGFNFEIWRVKPTASAGKPPKTFFGESAWMQARSYAADIDFGAWEI